MPSTSSKLPSSKHETASRSKGSSEHRNVRQKCFVIRFTRYGRLLTEAIDIGQQHPKASLSRNNDKRKNKSSSLLVSDQESPLSRTREPQLSHARAGLSQAKRRHHPGEQSPDLKSVRLQSFASTTNRTSLLCESSLRTPRNAISIPPGKDRPFTHLPQDNKVEAPLRQARPS